MPDIQAEEITGNEEAKVFLSNSRKDRERAQAIADRSGRPDLVLYVCMAAAILAVMMLFVQLLSVASSLLFGLMGMVPAIAGWR